MADITGLYMSAIERHLQGVRTISIDEMTGIQATERLEKDLPMRPGKVAIREFEYIRHGTLSLIANWDVAVGQVLTPSIGLTRNSSDFADHINNTIVSDPQAKWIFLVDQRWHA